MAHQKFIVRSISAGLLYGWFTLQVVSAAEPSAVPTPASAEPAAVAVEQAPVVASAQTAPAATSTVATTQTTTDPGDAIICKKEDVLGSRVRKVKVCRTKKEWQMEAQAAKDFTKGIDKGTAAQPGGETLSSGG